MREQAVFIQRCSTLVALICICLTLVPVIARARPGHSKPCSEEQLVIPSGQLVLRSCIFDEGHFGGAPSSGRRVTLLFKRSNGATTKIYLGQTDDYWKGNTRIHGKYQISGVLPGDASGPPAVVLLFNRAMGARVMQRVMVYALRDHQPLEWQTVPPSYEVALQIDGATFVMKAKEVDETADFEQALAVAPQRITKLFYRGGRIIAEPTDAATVPTHDAL